MTEEVEDVLMEERYGGVRETVKMLPHVPGVYVFKNAQKKIIYVGKAKDLKKRVSSYFLNLQHQASKTRILVKQIAFLDFIIVNTEEEALLLENNLIKENQPKYNILLKDDKSYPWVCITKEEYPRVFMTRNYIASRGKYYGPYTSSGSIQAILRTLRRLFFYRTCKLPLTQTQIEKKAYRSCLEYHINNCKAPCINAISKEEYNKAIENIAAILNGKVSIVISKLNEEYNSFMEALEFEKAEVLYKQIQELRDYQHKNSIVNPEVGDLDVISILEQENKVALNYMHVYNGAIVLSINRMIHNPLNSPLEELLEVSIYRLKEQYSSEAKTLLTNIENSITTSLYKDIETPQRGDKHRVLLLSTLNVDRYLTQITTERKLPQQEALEAVKNLLQLPHIPHRIECIDNSNTLGTFPVSAVVVFIDGKPAKDQYRIYNVKTVEGPNDYATMEEVITRRYSHLEADALPDLLLIDGGKGQLSAVVSALEKAEEIKEIPLAGLAERLEEIYVPRGTQSILLNKDHPALRLFIQLRDEAHRFGVKHHTHKRDKAITLPLEEVAGLGTKTIQKLYKTFGSIQDMRNAGKEALIACVGKSKAELVLRYFEALTTSVNGKGCL
jgi:excinuclease ABC, C subunit